MQVTADPNPNSRPASRLAAWAERRPVLFGLALFAGVVVFSIATHLLLAPLTSILSVDMLNIWASVIVSAVFAGLTTAMGWWRETGFRKPGNLALLLLPAAVAATLYGGVKVTGAGAWATIIIAAVLTGFLEEIIYRGLILRAFLPGGAMKAAVASSLFFSAMHLLNLVDGAPLGETLAQLAVAISTGIFMAGLTVRTGSIWPAIAYHTLHDLIIWMGQGGLAMGAEPGLRWIVTMLAGQAVLLVYGIVLLRGHRPGRQAA